MSLNCKEGRVVRNLKALTVLLFCLFCAGRRNRILSIVKRKKDLINCSVLCQVRVEGNSLIFINHKQVNIFIATGKL